LAHSRIGKGTTREFGYVVTGHQLGIKHAVANQLLGQHTDQRFGDREHDVTVILRLAVEVTLVLHLATVQNDKGIGVAGQ
jgi:hypothetical protein